MFDWLVWIERDNLRFLLLMGLASVVAIGAFIALRVRQRKYEEATQPIVWFGMRIKYERPVPRWVRVLSGYLALAFVMFWPAYALNDYLAARSIAHQMENLTGGEATARGNLTLADGTLVKCHFTDFQIEERTQSCGGWREGVPEVGEDYFTAQEAIFMYFEFNKGTYKIYFDGEEQ